MAGVENKSNIRLIFQQKIHKIYSQMKHNEVTLMCLAATWKIYHIFQVEGAVR